MAGQTTQVTMKINADTSAAQKQMIDLMRTLQNIQKTNFDSAFNNLGFDKAAKSAEVLANNIAKATNADTGKLDLTTLSANLRQSGTSAGELATNLLSAGTMGQQAFRQLSTAIASSEVPLKKMNTTLANMATTLKNTVKWELSSTAVHGLESALSGAVSYVKNLNSSLNDIRIVTGQSVEDMARFAQQANIAAKALSTTTKAYSDASLIYYQQGDNAEQAAKKAAITIKAANASFGTSAQEMSEYLTAVWNSYKVGADELERYVDIMAALGAKTATSLEEIATSMQKVAATANTVGVSMEQVSSIIATVSSVTRESAESIGTSYKTIFARMGDLKLGKTDDGVGLGQVSSQLKSIGVNVLDATGNLREMGDIITDLGNKWQTMSAAQKTATAQVVAGKRQYTQLMALFENWDMYNQNLDISSNADGSLQKMADTYAESWEAASNRLKASFEGLYSKLLNDEALIKFTNGITSVVESVSQLVDALGGLPGLLGNIGMIASKVFSNQIGSAAGKAATKISNVWSQKGVIAENILHPIKRAKGETREYKSVEQQKYARDLEVTKESYQTAIQRNPTTFKQGSAARAELDNSIAVIEAKQQLLAIEGRLGPAAAQAAQEAINGMQNELNMVQQLTQEYEDMQKAQKNKDKTDAAQLLVGETDVMPTGKKGKKKISTIGTASQSRQILDTRAQNAGFTGGWAEATAAWRENATQRSLVGRASSVVGQLDTDKFDRGTAGSQVARADAAAALKRERAALQASGIDSAAMQKADAAYDAFIKGLESDSVNDFENELKELQQALQAVQQELQQTADIMEHDLTQGAGTASKRIKQTLGDMEKEADESAEKIRQRAEAQVRANEEKGKIPTGKDKPAKKKMKDMTPEEKSDYIGKKAAKAANAISSLTASLSSASNLVDTLNDDSATLGDQVGAVLGTVGNIATGFATGGIVGGIAAVAGTAIGAVTSIIQAQKEADLAKKKAAREAAAEKVNESKAELDNQQKLMTNFNSLLNAKKEGQNVDEELKQTALDLADAYNVTGAAVANLTGDYENFIKTIQEAAGASGNMEESAVAAYEAAINATEQNSNISNQDSVWIDRHEQAYVNLAKKYGYGDDQYGGLDGKVWTRDLANGLGTELKDGYTVEDLLNEEALKLENGESFRELFMDGANLLISSDDSVEYKDMIYTRLQKAQEIMKQKGISTEDRLYKDMQSLINEMQFEIETYRQAKENLNNVQINAIASQYMNLDADNYAASQYFADWQTNYNEIKQILQKQDPTLQGEELEKLAITTMQQVTGTNSALSGFDSAMAAALEIYNNNVEEAINALDTIEKKFGNLDYANAEVILAYQAGGDWQKAYEANANREKGQMAITQAESLKNLKLTEDMTYEEMNGFYDTYTTLTEQVYETLQIGTMSFEDLMALSFEDRTNYLNNLSKMLEDSAGDIIDDALKEQRALVKSYEEILNDVKGIQVAKIGNTALTQQQWEEFLEKEANSLEAAQKFLIEYYTIGTDGKLTLRENYTDAQASTAKQKLNSEVQTVINNAMSHQFDTNETMGDYLSNQIFNRKFLTDAGITGVTDKQIQDAIKKYQQLRTAYIEANGTIDELTEMQLIWEAMGNTIDSVTSSIQKLTSAIKQLPTNTEELEKLAKLFNIDMDTLINSNSIQRARWVLGNDTAPTMDQFTTYVNGESVLSVDEYNKADYAERANYQQTIDYGGYIAAQDAYIQQQNEAFVTLTSGQNYQNAVNGIQTLTNAYLDFISTGEMTVEVQNAMRMNGIDPATIQSVEDYHQALIDMYATIQKNAKYAELLYEQTYGEYDRNAVWSAGQMDSAQYKAWAQVSQLYTEADAMQQSMDGIEEKYINSRLTTEKAQITKFKEELNKISSAADSGISLLNTYLSDIDNFSFSNIEKLRIALEDAGVAASIVESTLTRLTDVDTSDSDKIRAAMEASLQLAMSKIGTIEAQAMQYRKLTNDSEEPWGDLPVEQIFEWYYKRDMGQEVPEDVPWAGFSTVAQALDWYYHYNSTNETNADKIPTYDEFKAKCAGAAVEWSYKKVEQPDGTIDPTVSYGDSVVKIASCVVTWYFKEEPPEGETSDTLPDNWDTQPTAKVYKWNYSQTEGTENPSVEQWNALTPTEKKYIWGIYLASGEGINASSSETISTSEWNADAEAIDEKKYTWGVFLSTVTGASATETFAGKSTWATEAAAIIGKRYEWGVYDVTPEGTSGQPEDWTSPTNTKEFKYSFSNQTPNDPLLRFFAAIDEANEGTEETPGTVPFIGYTIGEVGADGQPLANGATNAPSITSDHFDLTYTYKPEGDQTDPSEGLDDYPEGKPAVLYYEYAAAGGTAPWEVFQSYLNYLYNDYVDKLNLAEGVEPPSMDEWLNTEGINGNIINTVLYSYDMADESDNPLAPNNTTITIFYKYQEASGSDHPTLNTDDTHQRADAINRYASRIRTTQRMENGEFTHTDWRDFIHDNYTQTELDDMLSDIIPDETARAIALKALADGDEKYWDKHVLTADWFTPLTRKIISQRQETEKQYAALLPEYTITAADLERTGEYDIDEISEIMAHQAAITQRGILLSSQSGQQWQTVLNTQSGAMESASAEYESAVQSWLSGDGADIAAQMIEATAQYLSDDPDVSAIGYELIRGIGAGLEAAGINMEQFLEASGLAPEVVAAFKAVLEINSPSRLTMALGQYLIDGLVVGTSKAAASMNFSSAVKGIDRKIFEALKAELDNGINLLATDDNAYFQGMQKAIQNLTPDFQLDEAQDGINIDDYIETQVEKYENGLEELEERVFVSREAAEAALAGMGLSVGEDNGITITETQMLDGPFLRDRPSPKARMVQLEGTVYKINISDEATEAAVEDMELALQDGVISTFTINWVNEGYKSDPNLTPFERQLIEDGLADAKIDLGMNSTDSFQTIEQVEEALDYLEEYYGMSLDDLMRQTENAWAQVADDWDKALKELLKLEAETAAEVYALWMNTFQAIATARKAIINDENIMDVITNEAEGEALIYKWLQEGKTTSEIQRLLHGGATANDVAWTSWNLQRHADTTREWSFLTQGPLGYQATNYLDYNRRVGQWAYGEIAEELETTIGKSMDADFLQGIVAKTISGTKAERTSNKALLSYLESEGYITFENGQYSYADGYENKILSNEFVGTILDGLYRMYSLDNQADADKILANALWSQYQAQDKIINGMIDEQTAARDKAQADLALVQKAMRGEELTVDEQNQLDEILGEGETLAMAFARLATAADTASTQLQLLKAAKEQGYVQGEDGLWYKEKVAGSRSVVVGSYTSEAEARAAMKAKYGSDEGFIYSTATTPAGMAMVGVDGTEYANPTGVQVSYIEDVVEKVLLGGTGQLTAEGLNITKPAEGLINTPENILSTYATMLNMTNDELREYISLIEEMDAGKDFDLTTAAGALHAAEVARITKEAGEGLEALRTDWSKTFGILKKETKVSTKELASTMSTFRKNMGKIFNVRPDLFDDKFIEENLDNFDKLMNGTEKEAAEAGKAIEKALLDKILTTKGENQVIIDVDSDGFEDELAIAQSAFDAFLAQNADAEVGTTVNMDTSGAIAGLNTLLSTGVMTAEGITAALNAIGWEPEITWEEHTGTAAQAQAAHGWVKTLNGYEEIGQDIESEQTLTYYIPKIGSITKTGSGGSAPKLNPSSGSGGGGGDKKPKQAKNIKFEDEVDRYHEVNQRLERMSELLEKIDKYKARAFGKGYLKNLEQETKMLKAQQAMYERKMEEAKLYYEQDSANMASKYGATFDEYGNMSNYDEVLAGIIADENSKIDYYNSLSAAEQKKLDEQYERDGGYLAYIAKMREDFKKDLAKMEDSAATLGEATSAFEEVINQISANNLEAITYKAEYQIELNDADRKLLQFYVDRYEDDVNKQAESFEKLIAQGEKLASNTEALTQKQKDLETAYAKGEITQADYAKGLQETRDALLENAQALLKLEKNVKEFYGNTLEMISDAFHEQVDHITAATDAMQSYINILGLMGKGQNYSEKALFYGQRAEFAQQEAIAKKAHLDLLLGQKADFDALIASGKEMTEVEKQWYEDLLNAIDDANGEFLKSVETALTYLQEKYQNAVAKISEDLDKALSGSFGSLEGLSDAYSYYTEVQGRYVSAARELYEVSKLNRDIEMSIEDATTSASKKMLKDLKDRINAQSELNQLTEYDIEMNRLQYELALAKIGLEEAQNAKDTVRLTRDESGNYIYQYTADNDKINEAQQTYEDVLQQINDLALNRMTELEQGFVEARMAYKEQYDAIVNDMNLTDEQRAEKLAILNERFKNDMDYYAEQMGIAAENLTTSNATIMQVYSEDLRNVSMTTRDGINEDIAALVANKDEAIESFQTAVTDAQKISEEHQKSINAFTSQTVGDYNTMKQAAENYGKAVEDAMGKAEDAVGPATDAMMDDIISLGKVWENFIDGPLEKFIDGIIDLAEEIQNTLDWLAELEGATATTPDIQPEDTKPVNPEPEKSTDDQNGGSGGTGGSGGEQEKTYYYKVNYNGSNLSTEYSTKAKAQAKIDSEISYWNQSYMGAYQSHQYDLANQYKATWDKWKSATISTFWRYEMGGLADFTGPAWLDGTKSRPELVLNATDTQNMLSAIGTLRELDTDSIALLVSALNAATNSIFSVMGGALSAAGMTNNHSQSINQNVEIHADFPNVTDKNEIIDALDDLVNRAAQYSQKKMW